jgi:hypothetical protein
MSQELALTVLAWAFVLIGLGTLPLFAVYYGQYFATAKAVTLRVSSWGPIVRLAGALHGTEWIVEMRSRIERTQATQAQKWAHIIWSMFTIALGATWLILTT